MAGWLLTTIPDNKRIFTIENGSRELDLVREKDGRVCNSVIHTITRESENAKQNIDQDMLLDMALRTTPTSSVWARCGLRRRMPHRRPPVLATAC